MACRSAAGVSLLRFKAIDARSEGQPTGCPLAVRLCGVVGVHTTSLRMLSQTIRALSHLNPSVWLALQSDFVKLCGEQVVFRSAEMFP